MFKVIDEQGQVYDPQTLDVLIVWIQEGRVLPTTNLIDPIDGRVFPAETHPLLTDYFQAVQPQVPPPQPPSQLPPNVGAHQVQGGNFVSSNPGAQQVQPSGQVPQNTGPVSYTHLRAHET